VQFYKIHFFITWRKGCQKALKNYPKKYIRRLAKILKSVRKITKKWTKKFITKKNNFFLFQNVDLFFGSKFCFKSFFLFFSSTVWSFFQKFRYFFLKFLYFFFEIFDLFFFLNFDLFFFKNFWSFFINKYLIFPEKKYWNSKKERKNFSTFEKISLLQKKREKKTYFLTTFSTVRNYKYGQIYKKKIRPNGEKNL